MTTNYEAKKRYNQKLYDQAPMVFCACGCGTPIKAMDRHGRPKSYISGHNGRKYDDPKQHKREWNHRHRSKRLQNKIERGRKLKVKVVQLLGGKCNDCSETYDGTNACIFQCHHRDPSQKRFAINTRTLVNFSWKSIEEELKRCVLLCANCHFKKHNEEY